MAFASAAPALSAALNNGSFDRELATGADFCEFHRNRHDRSYGQL